MIKEIFVIKNLELDGRIVMPPIATYKCTDDGKITEDVCDYYRARAKNPNVSLIVTEHSYIAKQGQAKEKQVSVSDDSDIPGLKSLVDAIHEGGAKAVCQINHAGLAAFSRITGEAVVAPSSIQLPREGRENEDDPKELTKEEIAKIVRWFSDAAGRVNAAGYDGVEIHSAHGYLLNQFYSPLTNYRTDEYGGSLDNRLRIHREVIAAVREAVGPDYPVFIRLGGSDYREGGSTIDDCVYAAKVFKEAGADLISLTGGMCGYVVPGRDYPGYFRDMSEEVKKEVPIAVLLTGGVNTLSEAESLLEEDAADLIGVGRALFKDANWETHQQ